MEHCCVCHTSVVDWLVECLVMQSLYFSICECQNYRAKRKRYWICYVDRDFLCRQVCRGWRMNLDHFHLHRGVLRAIDLAYCWSVQLQLCRWLQAELVSIKFSKTILNSYQRRNNFDCKTRAMNYSTITWITFTIPSLFQINIYIHDKYDCIFNILRFHSLFLNWRIPFLSDLLAKWIATINKKMMVLV